MRLTNPPRITGTERAAATVLFDGSQRTPCLFFREEISPTFHERWGGGWKRRYYDSDALVPAPYVSTNELVGVWRKLPEGNDVGGGCVRSQFQLVATGSVGTPQYLTVYSHKRLKRSVHGNSGVRTNTNDTKTKVLRAVQR